MFSLGFGFRVCGRLGFGLYALMRRLGFHGSVELTSRVSHTCCFGTWSRLASAEDTQKYLKPETVNP